MNWMIDGANGDLYRKAMGYPQLQPHDEWDVERQRGTRSKRSTLVASLAHATACTLNRLALALQAAAVSIHQPERKVS